MIGRPMAIQNLGYLEQLYAQWLIQPGSVSEEWQRYLESLGNPERSRLRFGPATAPSSIFNPPGAVDAALEVGDAKGALLQDRVNQLIRNYRVRGHMIASIDPLAMPRPSPPELELSHYGFSQSDLERRVSCETLQCEGPLTVREIFERLRNTYC